MCLEHLVDAGRVNGGVKLSYLLILVGGDGGNRSVGWRGNTGDGKDVGDIDRFGCWRWSALVESKEDGSEC